MVSFTILTPCPPKVWIKERDLKMHIKQYVCVRSQEVAGSPWDEGGGCGAYIWTGLVGPQISGWVTGLVCSPALAS